MTEIPMCMAPDPDTKIPVYKAPAGACDAHCHIFGPAGEFPYSPTRKYTPPDAGKDRLTALHGILGLERAVLVQASCHGTDNRAMVDAIASSNGKWKGVCIASDAFSDDEFAALNDGGVRGVRFNFVTHLGGAPDLDKMKRVVQRVKQFNWHLVIHVNAEDIVKHEDFFTQFDDLPIIVDHMGRVPTDKGVHQPAFKILCDFMRRENWWVKVCGAERISTAGPPFYDAVPYAQALIRIAPERILWGTDFPHPNIKKHMPNDGDLVDLIPLIMPDEAIQRQILVDNPVRLYGFDN